MSALGRSPDMPASVPFASSLVALGVVVPALRVTGALAEGEPWWTTLLALDARDTAWPALALLSALVWAFRGERHDGRPHKRLRATVVYFAGAEALVRALLEDGWRTDPMGGVLAALDGVGWATVCVTVGRELFRPPVGLSPQATWPLGALLGGLVLLRGHVSDRVDLGVATGLGLFTGLVATAVLRKRPLLHGGAGWLLALGVLLTRVAPEALLVSGDVREVMRAVAVAAVQSAAWMALGSTYALRRRAAVEATALVEAARHRA